MATSLGEENSEFKPVKLRIKNPILLVRGWGWNRLLRVSVCVYWNLKLIQLFPFTAVSLCSLSRLQNSSRPMKNISILYNLAVFLVCGVFMFGRYVRFEKFACATLANSSCSRPRLNWGLRAVMFLILSRAPPLILHARHMRACFSTRGKSSSLLQHTYSNHCKNKFS